jgi:transposase
MDTIEIFASALGITPPWYIVGLRFVLPEEPKNERKGKGGKAQTPIPPPTKGKLHVTIDFVVGARFAVPGYEGAHPVHDTVGKTYKHMNLFQHECLYEVRVPRVKLPDGSVRQVVPPWEGMVSGLTKLFEAFVLVMAQETTFSGAARRTGLSLHRTMTLCGKYVDAALSKADFSELRDLALDDTNRAKGQNYVTIFADAEERKVIFVAEGREAQTVEAFVKNVAFHHGKPSLIENVSIDMSPAYISGVKEHLPNATITFDKFHVIAHASEAVDETRRQEQKLDPSLKGMRWVLLKDRKDLTAEQRAELDKLTRRMTGSRTSRAWHYREQLREVYTYRQPNVLRRLLQRWCRNVLGSKVEEMKKVARMIMEHFEGVVAWARSQQTNGFLEAINGLFQAAKRKARGFVSFRTIRTVIFMIAGKLDFTAINPYVGVV